MLFLLLFYLAGQSDPFIYYHGLKKMTVDATDERG